MNAANKPRRGFTLVEMLCVMMLIAVLLTITTLLYRETLRVERIQSAGFDRILQSKMLADRFRADVAQAESDEPAWNQFKAGESTLILRMKNVGHIVYRWDEGILQRHVYAGDEEQQKTTLPIGGKEMEPEFVHAGKQRVVRLRVYPLRNDKRETRRALEFAAALGGDWR